MRGRPCGLQYYRPTSALLAQATLGTFDISLSMQKGTLIDTQIHIMQAMGTKPIRAQRFKRRVEIGLDTNHWRDHHFAGYYGPRDY